MKGNYYYHQYERERTITNAIAIVGRANAIDRAIKNRPKNLYQGTITLLEAVEEVQYCYRNIRNIQVDSIRIISHFRSTNIFSTDA